jgi:activator of HSP90 ATPase
MSYDFTLSATIPASPRDIYDAWLDSRRHAAMTGGKAKMSKTVGAKVSAWDGYILGENRALVPGKRIVQSWRTTKFTEKDGDSTIAVTLKPVKGGTRLTLVHSNVPDLHTSYQNGGWQTHYFEPMKTYFGKAGSKPKSRAKSQSKRSSGTARVPRKKK